MATTKTEHIEPTDAPKTNIITFAKGATAAEKMEALDAAKKALQDEVLNELDAEEAELKTKLADVEKRLNAILPPPPQQNAHPAGRLRTAKTSGPKTEGIKVSASRLKELIKGAGGELNLRKRGDQPGYDMPTIHKLIDENPGEFNLISTNKKGGKSPWPTIKLAK